MKLKSKFFYILPFLLLSACSDSDVPSNGDVEDSIVDLFSECKSISVDAKKTNGRPLENGNYLVNAEITLELEPIKENTDLFDVHSEKLKRYNEIASKKESNLNQFFENKNGLNNEYERLSKTEGRNGLNNEYERLSKTEGRDAEREAMYKWHEDELEKMRSAFSVIDDGYQNELNAVGLDSASIFREQGNNFKNICKIPSRLGNQLEWKMVGTINSSDDNRNSKHIEMLGKGIKNTFKTDLEMIKTENGWQLKQ